ncbi:MAG: endonuclease/exonuclease/phosphatase family protein [Anaerolineae bacterium]|nr:endonuclease/exonuclease/phosphatase family protein [Anaerolineae bacterium]
MTNHSSVLPKSAKIPNPLRILIGVINYLFIALVGAYGLSVTGQLLLHYIVGERLKIVAFADTFAHLLWLPALVLFPVCLLLRKRRLSLTLLPAVAAFVFTYGPQFLPRPVTTPAQGEPIRLLTFNILSQTHRFEVTDDILIQADADLVAMQEVSYNARSYFLGTHTLDYPYRAFYATSNAAQGMGILSRYPILEESFWLSDYVPTPRGTLRVVLDGPSGPITIYNAHPSHPGRSGSRFDPKYRGLEIANLLERARAEDVPVILMGDFNMPDISDDYVSITSEYTDAYRTVGWGMGWTFPDPAGGFPTVLDIIPLPRRLTPVFPFLRLDYVFYREGIYATHAEVWPTSGRSDHHPLLVDLQY